MPSRSRAGGAGAAWAPPHRFSALLRSAEPTWAQESRGKAGCTPCSHLHVLSMQSGSGCNWIVGFASINPYADEHWCSCAALITRVLLCVCPAGRGAQPGLSRAHPAHRALLATAGLSTTARTQAGHFSAFFPFFRDMDGVWKFCRKDC